LSIFSGALLVHAPIPPVLFVEFRFLVFFLLVFSVHWMLRSNTARKWWLLGASHFFYACFFIGAPGAFWDHLREGAWGKMPAGWWFPVVLWASTCLDYIVGLRIGDAPEERRRKVWLAVGLGVNLGVLGFFKYFNFFVGSAGDFLAWIGLPTSLHTLNIILPYGVSFYTFQSMSYSIDVYRRRLEPVRRFLDLAFFISFFPQLVAGPIVRAMTFLPQVFVQRTWASVDVRGCVTLFFIGFLKKAVISEYVARFADSFFAGPAEYDHASAILGVLCYAVQIYCDFSGYTDMAIATARLLGYELTVNFDFPYFARSITEFWRRWHISLSTWLRDYLYISLGGNRGSKLFTYRNLLLTMLLGGLWHGASWNFVLWGGMHGVALIVHREWQNLTAASGVLSRRVLALVAMPLTFYWICLTWIFFRAAPLVDAESKVVLTGGLEVAFQALRAFTVPGGHGEKTLGLEGHGALAVLGLLHWLNSRQCIAPLWRRLPDWACAILLGLATALALLFVPVKYKPFIYFQF
jgi:alginate O-acetyltransferase complex protein AlgI